MIKILDTKSKNFKSKFSHFLNLRRKNPESKINVVKRIVNDVRKYGDRSLIKYEKKFNNLTALSVKKLFFSKSEIQKNIKDLDVSVKNSIDISFKRISTFHKNQKFKNFKLKDNYNNYLSYRSKPLDKVGVYVPGGRASYPSSVLMNCVPAIIAGVKNIYMTVPSTNGNVNPGVLYAAKKCKVKKFIN